MPQDSAGQDRAGQDSAGRHPHRHRWRLRQRHLLLAPLQGSGLTEGVGCRRLRRLIQVGAVRVHLALSALAAAAVLRLTRHQSKYLS